MRSITLKTPMIGNVIKVSNNLGCESKKYNCQNADVLLILFDV
ncbi:hypothetical protein PTUN_b0569 [Pseudoalteromonas tunicata]|nr:hypothetical protein PTUN_b0569 [Pseudoalteromonas tunicata]